MNKEILEQTKYGGRTVLINNLASAGTGWTRWRSGNTGVGSGWGSGTLTDGASNSGNCGGAVKKSFSVEKIGKGELTLRVRPNPGGNTNSISCTAAFYNDNTLGLNIGELSCNGLVFMNYQEQNSGRWFIYKKINNVEIFNKQLSGNHQYFTLTLGRSKTIIQCGSGSFQNVAQTFTVKYPRITTAKNEHNLCVSIGAYKYGGDVGSASVFIDNDMTLKLL
jgi:hypothetical protein